MSVVNVKRKSTAIPISRTSDREIGGDRTIGERHTHDFDTMRRHMELELESRKLAWDRDVRTRLRRLACKFHLPKVAKMSTEFFMLNSPVHPSSPRPTSRELVVTTGSPDEACRSPTLNLGHRSPGSQLIDLTNKERKFCRLEDGRKGYRLRFDVCGFAPEEVSVSIEKGALVIKAATDHKRKGRGESREFNRRMDLPDAVILNTLEARVSEDGILYVEAEVDQDTELDEDGNADGGIMLALPVPSPPPGLPQDVEIITPRVNVHRDNIEPSEVSLVNGTYVDYSTPQVQGLLGKVMDGNNCFITSISPRSAPPASPNKSQPWYYRYSCPIVVISDGQRKFKLSVNIGKDFLTKDVVVGCKNDNKLTVEASSSGPTKRELSRTFEVDEKLEASTVRARLSKDGFVVIGASVAGNEDHESVMESIKHDLPEEGEDVKLVFK